MSEPLDPMPVVGFALWNLKPYQDVNGPNVHVETIAPRWRNWSVGGGRASLGSDGRFELATTVEALRESWGNSSQEHDYVNLVPDDGPGYRVSEMQVVVVGSFIADGSQPIVTTDWDRFVVNPGAVRPYLVGETGGAASTALRVALGRGDIQVEGDEGVRLDEIVNLAEFDVPPIARMVAHCGVDAVPEESIELGSPHAAQVSRVPGFLARYAGTSIPSAVLHDFARGVPYILNWPQEPGVVAWLLNQVRSASSMPGFRDRLEPGLTRIRNRALADRVRAAATGPRATIFKGSGGAGKNHRPELLIVGAGPQGLAVAAHVKDFLGVTPVVVDPNGWLGAWQGRFAGLELRTLDSPYGAHFHPHPLALASFVGVSPDVLGDPDIRPTAEDFARFCLATVDEFGLEVIRQSVDSVDVLGGGGGMSATLRGGRVIEADRVVLANNPTAPVLPAWSLPILEKGWHPIVHADRLNLRAVGGREGKRILIVGAGLTGTHLSLRLRDRGAEVTVISRSPIRSHEQLRGDPAWLASWDMSKFQLASPVERLAMVRAGHQPSAPQATIDEMSRRGVGIIEGVEVKRATWASNAFTVDFNDGRRREVFDEIILATGSVPDMQHDPIVAPLLRHRAARHARFWQGYPLLRADLTVPGTRAMVVGASSAMQLGPRAHYIFGARMAAQLIQEQLRRELNPRRGNQGL